MPALRRREEAREQLEEIRLYIARDIGPDDFPDPAQG